MILNTNLFLCAVDIAQHINGNLLCMRLLKVLSSCRPASTKIMGELRQVELCIRTYIVGVRWRATQEMEQIFTLADNSVPLTKSKLLIDTVAHQ